MDTRGERMDPNFSKTTLWCHVHHEQSEKERGKKKEKTAWNRQSVIVWDRSDIWQNTKHLFPDDLSTPVQSQTTAGQNKSRVCHGICSMPSHVPGIDTEEAVFVRNR